ncbi:MAG: hypothetical protein IME93_05885 [Proteobacteria bacterium]|nr:hypothetical protein [Pseudomonadota bacterium]
MRTRIIAIIVLLVTVPSVYAKDVLDIQLTAASDYVFRGISQTQNKGAAQAGFIYSHSSGPYFGLWSSYVDFPALYGDVDAEMDIYGGFAGDIESINMGWDLGYILYRYDESSLRYEETYFALSFDLLPKRLSAMVMGSYDSDGDHLVVESVVRLNLGEGFWVKVQPGEVDDRTINNTDYKYLKAVVGKRFKFTNSSIKSLDVELSYSDTNLERGDSIPYGYIRRDDFIPVTSDGSVNRDNESYVKDIWWLAITGHF